MGSPLYQDERGGQEIVTERQESFAEQYGVVGDARRHEHYPTCDRLAKLADAFSLQWQLVIPFYGWCWWSAISRAVGSPGMRFLTCAGSQERSPPGSGGALGCDPSP
jgi:hypothetical protein